MPILISDKATKKANDLGISGAILFEDCLLYCRREEGLKDANPDMNWTLHIRKAL